MNGTEDDRPAPPPATPDDAAPRPFGAPRRQRAVWPLVAAAAVVTAVAAWGLFGRGPATFGDLADLEVPTYTPVDMRAAPNQALATIFELGMSHFTSGDWPAAVEQLSRADRMLRASPAGGPPNQPLFRPFLRMYLGVATLKAGQTKAALAIFDELADPEVARPLRERGLWYGAQARLLLDDGAGAAKQLDELAGSPVYGQTAPALAAQVRKRLGN